MKISHCALILFTMRRFPANKYNIIHKGLYKLHIWQHIRQYPPIVMYSVMAMCKTYMLLYKQAHGLCCIILI